MSKYDEKIEDTRALYGRLRDYSDKFFERKTALQDIGVLGDLTTRDHIINEYLYDLDSRLRKIESILSESTGEETEQLVEIPLSVNHLKDE